MNNDLDQKKDNDQSIIMNQIVNNNTEVSNSIETLQNESDNLQQLDNNTQMLISRSTPNENIVQNVNNVSLETNEKVETTNNNNTSINDEKQKKKKFIPIIIIFIILILIGIAYYYLYYKKPFNQVINQSPNENTIISSDTSENDNSEIIGTNSIFDVNIMGNTISFPTTSESFTNIGWKWDDQNASIIVEKKTINSFGSISGQNAYANVWVLNNSEEDKAMKDCTIFHAGFRDYEPKKNRIVFIGGLNFNSTESEVKSKMEEFGFKNPIIHTYYEVKQYTYYKDDYSDHSGFHDNYIIFSFADGRIFEITINTKGY